MQEITTYVICTNCGQPVSVGTLYQDLQKTIVGVVPCACKGEPQPLQVPKVASIHFLNEHRAKKNAKSNKPIN